MKKHPRGRDGHVSDFGEKPDDAQRARCRYVKPRLQYLGEVRMLTAGGTPGIGDSGNPGIFLA